jgi:hypothetical protein
MGKTGSGFLGITLRIAELREYSRLRERIKIPSVNERIGCYRQLSTNPSDFGNTKQLGRNNFSIFGSEEVRKSRQ